MSEKVVVVGQGYVGLVLAIRASEVGFDVVGYEVDDAKVKRLAVGEPTTEDVSAERLAAALEGGRYRVSADPRDCAGFDYAVISVPTPLREGVPDLTHIETAASTLGPHLRRGACVVLESTTWPGTTDELVGPALEEASGLAAGDGFALGYSSERIDPASKEWTFEHIPKLVSGVDERSLTVIQGFYDRLVDTTVAVSGTREAELAKLLENTFRHVNIALVNELAIFAHGLGIDIWESIEAADTKPFGFMRFEPGPGVGGHCLPVDPSYLSWRVRRSLGHAFRFVELANDINDHMPEYVAQRLVEGLNARSLPIRGRRVLLLGLAFKRNTADAREAPSLPLAHRLLTMGADVRAADPHVVHDHVPAGVARVECTPEEVAAADAIVLLVDHDAFDLDMVGRTAAYALDCRHRLDGPNVEHL